MLLTPTADLHAVPVLEVWKQSIDGTIAGTNEMEIAEARVVVVLVFTLPSLPTHS